MSNKLAHLMFFGVSALLASAAQSQTAADMCESLGTTSESIMKKRQEGAPMSSLMKAIGTIDAPEAVQELLRETIIDAYEVPQYSGDSYRADAVRRFRNEVELECYKSL